MFSILVFLARNSLTTKRSSGENASGNKKCFSSIIIQSLIRNIDDDLLFNNEEF